MSKSLNNLTSQNRGFENVRDGYSGFEVLSQIVSQYIQATEDGNKALVAGAKEFVKDLRKLPKPISEIKKSGYTHLIRSFTYEEQDKEVVVGWGKYYGRMIEYGTVKMNAQPHFGPVFERNKEKYYKTMLSTLGINTWK